MGDTADRITLPRNDRVLEGVTQPALEAPRVLSPNNRHLETARKIGHLPRFRSLVEQSASTTYIGTLDEPHSSRSTLTKSSGSSPSETDRRGPVPSTLSAVRCLRLSSDFV